MDVDDDLHSPLPPFVEMEEVNTNKPAAPEVDQKPTTGSWGDKSTLNSHDTENHHNFSRADSGAAKLAANADTAPFKALDSTRQQQYFGSVSSSNGIVKREPVDSTDFQQQQQSVRTISELSDVDKLKLKPGFQQPFAHPRIGGTSSSSAQLAGTNIRPDPGDMAGDYNHHHHQNKHSAVCVACPQCSASSGNMDQHSAQSFASALAKISMLNQLSTSGEDSGLGGGGVGSHEMAEIMHNYMRTLHSSPAFQTFIQSRSSAAEKETVSAAAPATSSTTANASSPGSAMVVVKDEPDTSAAVASASLAAGARQPAHHQNNKQQQQQQLTAGNTNISNCTKTTTTTTLKALSPRFLHESGLSFHLFNQWNENEQVLFLQFLLDQMQHTSHARVDQYLRPKLQRDFIALLPKIGMQHIAEAILEKLEYKDLCTCEEVSPGWRRTIADGMQWKKLIERHVLRDPLWRGLGERHGWIRHLFKRLAAAAYPGAADQLAAAAAAHGGGGGISLSDNFFQGLYPNILKDISQLEENWRTGKHILQRINCRSENSKGVYCLQYDEDKIVSGLRDNTIKIWDKQTLRLRNTLTGHTGSVLCLQYDDRIIISGSSDATVRVWNVQTGESLGQLIHHCEAVLHLRFGHGIMVTCSKDRSIAVWDMASPRDINFRRNLVGHRAAVNVVDFDEKYIVSASGDRSIRVWNTQTCEQVRQLVGHRRGIACLQYRDKLVVSGSSDYTIRIWDIEAGNCLRVLEGHEELVRCIRFDSKRIVSGAYDGKIKVWDLEAALDMRKSTSALCIQTLVEHSGRVFRLQFDEFQIVSSSHDDTILIWDFYNGRKAISSNAAAGSGGGGAPPPPPPPAGPPGPPPFHHGAGHGAPPPSAHHPHYNQYPQPHPGGGGGGGAGGGMFHGTGGAGGPAPVENVLLAKVLQAQHHGQQPLHAPLQHALVLSDEMYAKQFVGRTMANMQQHQQQQQQEKQKPAIYYPLGIVHPYPSSIAAATAPAPAGAAAVYAVPASWASQMPNMMMPIINAAVAAPAAAGFPVGVPTNRSVMVNPASISTTPSTASSSSSSTPQSSVPYFSAPVGLAAAAGQSKNSISRRSAATANNNNNTTAVNWSANIAAARQARTHPTRSVSDVADNIAAITAATINTRSSDDDAVDAAVINALPQQQEFHSYAVAVDNTDADDKNVIFAQPTAVLDESCSSNAAAPRTLLNSSVVGHSSSPALFDSVKNVAAVSSLHTSAAASVNRTGSGRGRGAYFPPVDKPYEAPLPSSANSSNHFSFPLLNTADNNNRGITMMKREEEEYAAENIEQQQGGICIRHKAKRSTAGDNANASAPFNVSSSADEESCSSSGGSSSVLKQLPPILHRTNSPIAFPVVLIPTAVTRARGKTPEKDAAVNASNNNTDNSKQLSTATSSGAPSPVVMHDVDEHAVQ